MTEQEDLIDMAHTIIVRMALRGGHDSYTGSLMGKWLRMYESRPTPLAPDGADVCHIVTHFFIDGTCAMCGVPEPRPAGKA